MGTTLKGELAERALATAARLHTNLCVGMWPQPTAPGFRLASGEVAYANFWNTGDVEFTRYITPQPVSYHRPGHVVVGSPQFVTGYAMASLVTNAVGHHRARKMSRPFWAEPRSAAATVTDRRLWCSVGGEKVYFDYAATTSVEPDLRHLAVTLRFVNAAPLRLSGRKAPSIAVYFAHRVYGHAGAEQMPELARLR